jgi:aspartate/methionine/tyrosine aminotransferase
MQTPIPFEIVNKAIQDSGIPNIGKASIREIVRLINTIEKQSGQKFIRMEMGVPGLAPSQIGINAEIDALRSGVASIYPAVEGIPELKSEASRFMKLFLDVDIKPEGIIPTVGSMQGGFAAFLMCCRRDTTKDTTLFLDPGFPVQKQQHHVLGLKYESFDIYNYRGDALRAKLESYLQKGNISTMLYSSPNNPSWVCLTQEELKVIGELATKYGVIVIEDLAYFGMDFREDYSRPGIPPHQPTVAHYTNNYILLISSSKVFSYAGQRIGLLVISDSLFNQSFPDLKRFYSSDKFGYATIYGAVYALSSGTCHTVQFAMAAMLKAVNDNNYNFVDGIKEYGERARIMKRIFVENGFKIVYDKDLDRPLADGFYFTISYPGMTGAELLEELMYYGVSAITLDITGSEHSEGLRACVSQVQMSQISSLEDRLKAFAKNHN